jgi:hypothetical protein
MKKKEGRKGMEKEREGHFILKVLILPDVTEFMDRMNTHFNKRQPFSNFPFFLPSLFISLFMLGKRVHFFG